MIPHAADQRASVDNLRKCVRVQSYVFALHDCVFSVDKRTILTVPSHDGDRSLSVYSIRRPAPFSCQKCVVLIAHELTNQLCEYASCSAQQRQQLTMEIQRKQASLRLFAALAPLFVYTRSEMEIFGVLHGARSKTQILRCVRLRTLQYMTLWPIRLRIGRPIRLHIDHASCLSALDVSDDSVLTRVPLSV